MRIVLLPQLGSKFHIRLDGLSVALVAVDQLMRRNFCGYQLIAGLA